MPLLVSFAKTNQLVLFTDMVTVVPDTLSTGVLISP